MLTSNRQSSLKKFIVSSALPLVMLLASTTNAYAIDRDKEVARLKKFEANCSAVYVADQKKLYKQKQLSMDGSTYLRKKIRSVSAANKLIKNDICSERRIVSRVLDFDGEWYLKHRGSGGAVCYKGAEKLVDTWIAHSKAIVKNSNAQFRKAERDKVFAEYQPACISFYTNKYFGPEIARMKKAEKKALLAKQNRAKAAAAEKKKQKALKKKQLAAQKSLAQSKEAQRNAIYDVTGLSKEKRILWSEGLVKEYAPNRSGDISRHINVMNKEIMRELNPDNKKAAFIAPKKGEFEKTANYEKRLASEKKKFTAKEKAKRDAILKDEANIRQKTFNKYFGAPSVKSVKYNADGEYFDVVIGSSTSSYKIAGKYNAPIAQAKSLKATLTQIKPAVVFSVDTNAITPAVVMLDFATEITTLSSNDAGIVPITTGDEALAEWNEVLKQERVARSARLKQERKAEAAVRAARTKIYGHEGPFLVKGAFVCEGMESMFRMMAIRRANGYVSDPADCIVSSADIQPIIDVQHLQGNISRVTLKKAALRVFTPTSDIAD